MLQLLGVDHPDGLQVGVVGVVLLGRGRLGGVGLGVVVGRTPPPVARVAARGVLDDEAVLLELAEVVGRGPAVQAEPGREHGGRGRALAQQAQHAETSGVAERLEPLGTG
nr:hypothetical protein [Nocardioides ungokensis]